MAVGGRGGEPLGRLGRAAVADDARERLELVLLDRLLAGEDERARAVVDRRGVGGGDGPVLREGGLERRRTSPACRRAGPRRPSRGARRPSSAARSTGSISAANRPSRCAASARRKLSFANSSCASRENLYSLRAELAAVAHVDVAVRVPEAVVDHAVDERGVAHARAAARGGHVVRARSTSTPCRPRRRSRRRRARWSWRRTRRPAGPSRTPCRPSSRGRVFGIFA